MAPCCARGSIPRSSTTTADSPRYFFGSNRLAATAITSMVAKIQSDIFLCTQRIRINCERRIKCLACVSEQTCLDQEHIVGLQCIFVRHGVLAFLARCIHTFHYGAALRASRREAAADGNSL